MRYPVFYEFNIQFCWSLSALTTHSSLCVTGLCFVAHTALYHDCCAWSASSYFVTTFKTPIP